MKILVFIGLLIFSGSLFARQKCYAINNEGNTIKSVEEEFCDFEIEGIYFYKASYYTAKECAVNFKGKRLLVDIPHYFCLNYGKNIDSGKAGVQFYKPYRSKKKCHGFGPYKGGNTVVSTVKSFADDQCYPAANFNAKWKKGSYFFNRDCRLFSKKSGKLMYKKSAPFFCGGILRFEYRNKK